MLICRMMNLLIKINGDKMANILFITSSNYHNPDACGVCVQKIMNELKNDGHNLHCICAYDDDDPFFETVEDVKVYKIKRNYYMRKKSQYDKTGKNKLFIKILILLRRIRTLFILPMFPDVEPQRSRKIFRFSKKVLRENNIDCVIGIFRPFDDISAVLKIKKHYPDIICGGYYLDILKGGVVPKPFPKKIYDKLCETKEFKIFNKLDFVLMAENGKELYDIEKFKDISHKIFYVNFPVFKKNECINENLIKYDNEYFNIVYAGYLYRSLRNPYYFFKLLENLIKNGQKIKMHIYGNSDCADIIDEFCSSYPDSFVKYGSVKPDVVAQAISASDAVLNILNTISVSVPSKVFELCSSCKPIITVINDANDRSVEYLNNYPNVCFINEYEHKEDADIEKLMSFVMSDCKKEVIYEEIEPLFYSSTPKATTNIINRFLNSTGG